MSSSNVIRSSLFTALFSKEEVMAEFIELFLPEEFGNKIDLQSLSVQHISYLYRSPILKKFYYDIIHQATYEKENIKLVLLFAYSHAEGFDPQLLISHYMIEAWSQILAREKRLEPLIPILIYRGNKKKNYSAFSPQYQINDPIHSPFLPRLTYFVLDFASLTEVQRNQMPSGIIKDKLLGLIDL